MDPFAEDRPTRPRPGMLVWILLIAGIFTLSGFIPLILLGRSTPIESMYRNCVEGESGIDIGDRLVIESADGAPIAITYPEIRSVPSDVQQLCFDLVVRAARYG